MAGSRQAHDLEAAIYAHLETAGKIGNQELESDISLNNVQTKSWHIAKAAEAAEIAGWKKTDIAFKLIEAIEKHGWNISKAQVYRVCSPLGYSNTRVDDESHDETHNSSTKTPFDIENAQEEEDIEEFISFLKETVLKKLSERSYINKILLKQEVAQAKADLERAKKTKDKISIDAAEKILQELEERADRNWRVYQEHRYNRKQLLNDARESWDERQSSNVYEQHMLLMCLEEFGVTGGAEIFKTMVKDISLVPKQAQKYLTAEIRDLLPLYDPKNRDEALKKRFYGAQCTHVICQKCHKSSPPGTTKCDKEIVNRRLQTKHLCNGTIFEPCGSWRVKPAKDGGGSMLHCFACLATFRAPPALDLPEKKGTQLDAKMQEMFSKTYPEWQRNNGVCPKCKGIMSIITTAEGKKFVCPKCKA